MPSMALTQSEIALHLDIDQSAVSRLLRDMEIDWKTSTLDHIRVAYVRRLRAQAAGHRSDGGLDLVHERVLTERVDREMKMLTLAEKKSQLVNVAQLEGQLMQMFSAFKTELSGRDTRLKAALDERYGIDVDPALLSESTYAALHHLSRYDPGERQPDPPIVRNDQAAGTPEPESVGA